MRMTSFQKENWLLGMIIVSSRLTIIHQHPPLTIVKAIKGLVKRKKNRVELGSRSEKIARDRYHIKTQ